MVYGVFWVACLFGFGFFVLSVFDHCTVQSFCEGQGKPFLIFTKSHTRQNTPTKPKQTRPVQACHPKHTINHYTLSYNIHEI